MSEVLGPVASNPRPYLSREPWQRGLSVELKAEVAWWKQRGAPFDAGNGFVWPTPYREGTITTPFRVVDNLHPKPHNGIDIGHPDGGQVLHGNPVFAVRGGVVDSVSLDPNAQGGLQVRIEHFNADYAVEYTSGYAHLNEVLVEPGQVLEKGDIIGTAGTTGHSTATHLHFTLRDDTGETIDPLKVLTPPWRSQQ